LRRSKFGETVASTLWGLHVLDSVGEHLDDGVVSSKAGEVFEREIDRSE
jgi:hypothetical protein